MPLIDGTAARALGAFVRKLQRGGTEIYFSAARPNVRQALSDVGLKSPHVIFVVQASDVTGRWTAPLP